MEELSLRRSSPSSASASSRAPVWSRSPARRPDRIPTTTCSIRSLRLRFLGDQLIDTSKATPARTRIGSCPERHPDQRPGAAELRDRRSRGSSGDSCGEVRAARPLVRPSPSPPAGRRRSDARPAGVGQVDRISPEAPVPVVHGPGSFHLVGRRTWPPTSIPRRSGRGVGVVGTDSPGARARRSARSRLGRWVIRSSRQTTTQKIRILAHQQQGRRLIASGRARR